MKVTELRHTRKKLGEVHQACELRTQHFERLFSDERIEEKSEENFRWRGNGLAGGTGVAGGINFVPSNQSKPPNALHELVSFYINIDVGTPPGPATVFFSFDSQALFKGAVPANVNVFWASTFTTQNFAKQFARRMIIPRGNTIMGGVQGLTSGQKCSIVVYSKIHYPNPNPSFLARPGGF